KVLETFVPREQPPRPETVRTSMRNGKKTDATGCLSRRGTGFQSPYWCHRSRITHRVILLNRRDALRSTIQPSGFRCFEFPRNETRLSTKCTSIFATVLP